MTSVRTGHDAVLLSFNELHLRCMLCFHHSVDRRVLLRPNSTRPVGLPDSACQLVEDQIESLMAILFRIRVGQQCFSEDVYLDEMSDLIYQIAASEQGYIHADIEAAAVAMNMTAIPLYVALAIYAKLVATKLHNPPLIQREDKDGVVHFRSLC